MNWQTWSAKVADELEDLASATGPIRADHARSTINLYTASERVWRASEVAEVYLDLQRGVESDGRAAIVTAGPPGAGKTTTLENEGLLSGDFRNIDPDIIKEMLLERAVTDGIFDDLLALRLADGRPLMPMELATLVHRESTAIAESLLRSCMSQGENVLVQGTLAWDQQPHVLLTSLHAGDYFEVSIIDAEVDLSTAIARSRSRWWTGRTDHHSVLGGRFVPVDFIKKLFVNETDSVCKQNAEVMFAMSDLPATRLIRTESREGDFSRVERVKGLALPSPHTSLLDGELE